MDFLGNNFDEHYMYFEKLCKDKASLKEILEIKHYVFRTTTPEAPV